MDKFFADYLALLQAHHRDLIASFDGLPQEALDWVPGSDMNSLCVLVVHTTGAARFWVGDAAMHEPSGRNRAAEFQARGWTESALKERIISTEAYVSSALERLQLIDLSKMSDIAGRGEQVTAGWALLHALEHTGLHVGHAQITRQLWDQRSSAG
jgi:uncharacterized damage-inducible protein DinB